MRGVLVYQREASFRPGNLPSSPLSRWKNIDCGPLLKASIFRSHKEPRPLSLIMLQTQIPAPSQSNVSPGTPVQILQHIRLLPTQARHVIALAREGVSQRPAVT